MKQKCIVLFSIVILFSACEKSNKQELKVVDLKENKELTNIALKLEGSITDFMIDSGTASYSILDVKNCIKIIDGFLIDLSPITDIEEALKIVENSILKLNDLNAKCNGGLIETSEREKIVEIIIFSGYLKGLNTREEDITEEWREW